MKNMTRITATVLAVLSISCVYNKKYTELEDKYNNTRSTLSATQIEKYKIEAKYAAIEERVNEYNAKINSLRDASDEKLDLMKGNAVISENAKKQMRETLKRVDATELAQAVSLRDSMNLAISHNLKKDLGTVSEGDDVDINIEETVVMISISEKLLFSSGSARVSRNAETFLQRLADVINSEPAIEIMVEGHTDDRSFKDGASMKDNWELSVERSTAIIRELQDNFNVDPKKMIAAGRSSYAPLVPNDSKEHMARNRRTRIVILPNLDKFLALLSD